MGIGACEAKGRIPAAALLCSSARATLDFTMQGSSESRSHGKGSKCNASVENRKKTELEGGERTMLIFKSRHLNAAHAI